MIPSPQYPTGASQESFDPPFWPSHNQDQVFPDRINPVRLPASQRSVGVVPVYTWALSPDQHMALIGANEIWVWPVQLIVSEPERLFETWTEIGKVPTLLKICVSMLSGNTTEGPSPQLRLE